MSDADEQTYTLTEARRELALRECGRHGHDFDVVVKLGGEPAHILCGRCGKSWTVRTSGRDDGSHPGRTDAADGATP